ncbi:MAG: PDZ domain-containing protein [Pseudolysinimonas sp.]
MRSTAPLVGWILMIAAIAGAVVLGTLPAPYVLESPGPVYDTIGDIDIAGESTPVIDVEGEKTYPTSGTLDMLTVTLRGNREAPLSWIDLAIAWFDRTRAVLPIEAVYPEGETQEQSSQQSTADMVGSQQEAVAAALGELDIDYTSIVTVSSTLDGYPADGVLEPGDQILTVDGDEIDGVTELTAALKERPVGSTFSLGIVRDGEAMTVQLTTAGAPDDATVPIVGIQPGARYDFPFDVTVNLGDVGGPSAGTMLALGIYDKLTPGELTGGEKFAGTGTIAADGEVGPIGGIRQKMYGAQNAGADWFLAPAANCDEVVGHIPAGLQVFAISTLDDALHTVETVADGADTSSLARCT